MLNNQIKEGDIIKSDFKTYYREAIMTTPWYWHKYRHVEQQNGIESPEIKAHIYNQLIFNK